MPSETGIVDTITPRDKTYSVAVNKQWFGGFGKCPVNKGDSVEIEWKQKGDFKNIVKMQTVEKPKTLTPPKRTDSLAEDIHLQVCLKATATLHTGSKATPKEIAKYTRELMTELWT